MTVHGEQALVPSATRPEAATALKDFLVTYNKAEQAYDARLLDAVVAGPYGDGKKAGLRTLKALKPGGNTKFKPLVLSDASFVIPKATGWPRFFVANTDSNRDTGTSKASSRVMLVFTKFAADLPWKVTYVAVLMPQEVPAFTTDPQGWAEPLDPHATDLAIAPAELSKRYTAYLADGRPNGFAPGDETTGRRAVRARYADKPGMTTQWIDQPLDAGAYLPIGLRTQNGGGFVFFSSRHVEQQKIDKSVKGAKLPTSASLRALITGTADTTLVREFLSAQTVSVPPAGPAGAKALFLSRTQALVSAQGS